MKRLSFINLLFAVWSLLALSGCSEEAKDYSFRGQNYVQLSVKGSSGSSLLVESDEPLTVDVLTATTSEQDETIEFELVNNAADGGEVLRAEGAVLTLKAGEKQGSFLIYSNHPEDFVDPQTVVVRMKQATSERMVGWNELSIVVNPNPTIGDLTEEQRELIEGYQEKYGLNLNRFIGELSCNTLVSFSEYDYGNPVAGDNTERRFAGTSIITLSEYATADVPVLKMTFNPMGLTDFFYEAMRKLTFEDSEYWLLDPFSSGLAGLVKFDVATDKFSMTLDSLVIDPRQKTISILADGVDLYDTPIKRVPFQYTFTAWERAQQLAKEGAVLSVDENGTIRQYPLQDVITGTGTMVTAYTLDPADFLGISDIGADMYEDGSYFQPEGHYDVDAGTLTFAFPWDYLNYSGSYTRIQVTYTLND